MAEHIERFNPDKALPIITYGLPFEDAIAKHLTTTLSRKHPYLLISGSLSRSTNVVDRLTKRLRSESAEVAGTCKGIRSHTLYEDLLPILAAMRKTKADSIVVVGGGSLVDAAKVLSFALANGVDSHEGLDELGGGGETNDKDGQVDTRKPSEIPYMCASSTLSAGEYSTFGGATNERTHHKQLFFDPSPDNAGHRVLVIDPRLTLTTPRGVWLSTGMRAVDHCVETVCAAEPTPEATAAALQGLRQLLPALLRSKKDANDLDARLQAQLGAGQSMKGVVVYGVKLGASHGIGHQLGPQGVPHAGEFFPFFSSFPFRFPPVLCTLQGCSRLSIAITFTGVLLTDSQKQPVCCCRPFSSTTLASTAISRNSCSTLSGTSPS